MRMIAIAALLALGLAKLALLAVAMKGGFLGGPTFPAIFASVSVALAISLLLPGLPVEVVIGGIMAGFLLQWPTLLTLLMFPILAVAYVRLAISEEREVRAKFDAEYARYVLQTPRFIPRIGLRRAWRMGAARLGA